MCSSILIQKHVEKLFFKSASCLIKLMYSSIASLTLFEKNLIYRINRILSYNCPKRQNRAAVILKYNLSALKLVILLIRMIGDSFER